MNIQKNNNYYSYNKYTLRNLIIILNTSIKNYLNIIYQNSIIDQPYYEISNNNINIYIFQYNNNNNKEKGIKEIEKYLTLLLKNFNYNLKLKIINIKYPYLNSQIYSEIVALTVINGSLINNLITKDIINTIKMKKNNHNTLILKGINIQLQGRYNLQSNTERSIHSTHKLGLINGTLDKTLFNQFSKFGKFSIITTLAYN